MSTPPARHPTPQPTGPLSGRRRSWRRSIGKLLAGINRVLEPLPPGQWIRRRLHRGRTITGADVVLEDGGIDLLHLVFLSDVHAGLFMGADDFLAVAEQAAALRPDLVCLGGDLVNTRWQEVELLRPGLERLEAPLGIYAVPGNHEYYRRRDLGRWRDSLEAQGVRVLLNAGCRVETGGTSLWIAGVDDLTEGKPDFDAALAGRREGEATILLSHHPDTFLEASELGVRLQLSGHTHGGQVMIRGRAPLSHSRHGYVAGTYGRNGAHLYVSRGVGVTALPIRYRAPAEISLLRLRGE